MSFIIDVDEEESNSPIETMYVQRDGNGKQFIELSKKYAYTSLRFNGTYHIWSLGTVYNPDIYCIMFSPSMSVNLNWPDGTIVKVIHMSPLEINITKCEIKNYR